jgi:hypothetical protein
MTRTLIQIVDAAGLLSGPAPTAAEIARLGGTMSRTHAMLDAAWGMFATRFSS